MKKSFLIVSLLFTCILLFSACTQSNSQQSSPTTIPTGTENISCQHIEVVDSAVKETCTTTGKTEGKHCSKCGEILIKQNEIAATGHDWETATCTAPKTCKVCNEKNGDAIGHDWEAATCTTPKTCTVCKDTEGNALGHVWAAATCTEPKTCSVCSETNGSANGHNWVDATCQSPKTCSACNETEGSVENHQDSGNGLCSYCKQDMLLIELQNGFNVQLIIPTVGGLNGYATAKYTNQTKYSISVDNTFLSANGKLLYNSSAKFTLEPGYYATVTYFRAIIASQRYDDKYKDLYLDNNSLAHISFQVSEKTVFVKFGVNGPVAFGYSLNDIGIY